MRKQLRTVVDVVDARIEAAVVEMNDESDPRVARSPASESPLRGRTASVNLTPVARDSYDRARRRLNSALATEPACHAVDA